MVYGSGAIEADSFRDWTDVTVVVIDDGVVGIGESAFEGCTSLKGVIIPTSVVEIADCAFRDCACCTVAIFKGNAPRISEYSFMSVPADVYYGGLFDGWTEDVRQNYGGTLTWHAVDEIESVHIWGEACYQWAEDYLMLTASHESLDCENVIETESVAGTETIISPTVEMEGRREFVSDPFENPAFAVQFESAVIPALSAMRVLRIPDSVHTIDIEAFAEATFEAIIVPDACKYIGSRAFSHCGQLIYIRVPAGVTIEPDAFEGCRSVAIDEQ